MLTYNIDRTTPYCVSKPDSETKRRFTVALVIVKVVASTYHCISGVKYVSKLYTTKLNMKAS